MAQQISKLTKQQLQQRLEDKNAEADAVVDELVEATRRLQEAKLTLGIQSTECQEKVATVQSLAKRSRALEREIEVYEDALEGLEDSEQLLSDTEGTEGATNQGDTRASCDGEAVGEQGMQEHMLPTKTTPCNSESSAGQHVRRRVLQALDQNGMV